MDHAWYPQKGFVILHIDLNNINFMDNNKNIELEHGGGGGKSADLISEMRKIMKGTGKWKHCDDDGAVFNLGKENLVFTTDAYIVDPLFFPGGDIGKICMCGTINDLAMMGARPIGISLSMVIEEGFSKKDLMKIVASIQKVSKESGVPVVTGDTKVIDKGKIDKIEITTAGVGLASKIIPSSGMKVGDAVIVSGDLGEHTVALLSERFGYKSKVKSDSKTLHKEIEKVGKYLNALKDPTRGGLSANLIEMAEKSKVKVVLEENLLPYKKETKAISELLGIDVFSFASEGRFVATVAQKNVKKVLKILKKYNPEAKVIGEVEKGKGMFLKTSLGTLRKIEMPRGKLVPRIC
jgi:hydrogenase expression/formation protein HypE